MGTPASKRMVTRSQAGADNPVSSSQESDVKSRQRKSGQALTDITNDSPVVGLTCGSVKTPLTRMVGRSGRTKAAVTPGSGEALLRGQVKNLLQMVEEEAEVPKLPRYPFVRSFTDSSPITLLAPANTPQVPDSGDASGLELPTPIVQEPINISQALSDAFEARGGGPLTRSLMLEFLEKDESDVSECYSTVSVGERKSLADDDDDGSSIWSMQVNGTSVDEYKDGVIYKDVDGYDECAEQEVDDKEVCRGMNSLSVNGGIGRLPLFSGKHIRFVYNSDDEDEVVAVDEAHH